MKKLNLTVAEAPALRALRALLSTLTVLLACAGLVLIVAPGSLLSPFYGSSGIVGGDAWYFLARSCGPVLISLAYLCAIVRSLRVRELVTLFGASSGNASKSP